MTATPENTANHSSHGRGDSSASGLAPFDYSPRTRVVFGPGSLRQVGTLAKEYGAERVLIFTDPGVLAAGHIDRCHAALADAGLSAGVFSDVTPNPTTRDVARGVEAARDFRANFLVAVGGGSSMDCAKGVNFLLTNGGEMKDYWGTGKAAKPMLPLIAAPTTAGTGSEAQSYALISDEATHVKMACGDKKAACKVAILDPELTLSMPPGVTAATGIDAFSHAIESYVCLRRNAVSCMFSREAFVCLQRSLPLVLSAPGNLVARGDVLLGAHWAGAAIETSMLGAAHALANPLTARFGITHGVAIALTLPHVIRHNAGSFEVAEMYRSLIATVDPGIRTSNAGAALARWVESLASAAGYSPYLRDWGVTEELIPTLANEAASQWTATFNPRPVDAGSLEGLYRCAWSAR